MSFEVGAGSSRGESAFLVSLLFIYGFVGWSVLFPAVGIPRALVTGAVTAGAFCIILSRPSRNREWVFVAIALIALTALIHSGYWMSLSSLFLVWSLSLALILVAYARDREIDILIDVATAFVLLLIVGAAIAQIYNVLGGRPWVGFDRPGDEENRLLVLPFSLGLEGRIDGDLRVTGIYDEPGALSFVICVVAFLRRRRGKHSAITWALLGLGTVTFSLAHLVFILCFLLSADFTRREALRVGIVAVSLASLAVLAPIGEVVLEKVGTRIVGEEIEGRLVRGDNRSERFLLAVDTLVGEKERFLIGINPSADPGRFKMLGENPLTPLARYGIFGSWPYYAYLTLGLLLLFRGRKNLSFFGVVLLLAQRPYVQSDGYSLLAMLALWAQLGGHPSWLRSLRRK